MKGSRESISLYPCWPATVLAASPSAPESLLARSRLRPPANEAIALLLVPLSLRRRLRPCDTVGRLSKENWDRSHDPRGDGRPPGPLPPRDLRRRRRDGRVSLNVRAVRAVAAEADGMIFGSGAAGRGARGPMLLPILLRLTGWAAWWLPAWLDRFLSDVRFGH